MAYPMFTFDFSQKLVAVFFEFYRPNINNCHLQAKFILKDKIYFNQLYCYFILGTSVNLFQIN